MRPTPQPRVHAAPPAPHLSKQRDFGFSTGRECRNVRASRREMRPMQRGLIMSARTGAAAILAGLLASAVAIDRAAAADENSWPRFPGSAYGSQSEPTDREFIKEWEATPPKGYPTLS